MVIGNEASVGWDEYTVMVYRTFHGPPGARHKQRHRNFSNRTGHSLYTIGNRKCYGVHPRHKVEHGNSGNKEQLLSGLKKY
jgi:hypothetical protein